MNLLLDTNIILWICRDLSEKRVIDYINPEKKLIYISIVSLGEIKSIAFQQDWADKKLGRLEEFVDTSRILDFNESVIPSYVTIDAYSQRKHKEFSKYPFKTPRNMGKNDLWIAATAHFINLELVTTDTDFDHLDNIYNSIRKVSIYDLKKLIK